MNVRLVSVKTIINRVYRRLNLNEDLPEDDMIEWVGEALLRVGAFSQFVPKVCQLEISNGKVAIPCDFYKLVDINYTLSVGTNLVLSTFNPLQWKSESFFSEYFCDECKVSLWSNTFNPYFMINNAYIYTSFNEGTICISYLAVPTDEEGYPMVPDDEMTLDACSKYIIYQLDYREWRKGAIQDKVFQHSEREWHFGVGAAKGSLNMPNAQQLETIKNVIQRLIPNQRYNSNPERRKIH
tara:strand:- start:2420 stop:3136 length:717 start_codon:yes stop_codon:yes gene_type:complete